MIRRTATQDRLQTPAAAAEGAGGGEAKDFWEHLEIPALQSSLTKHRIVDVEPRTKGPTAEVPEVEEGSIPLCAEPGSRRGEEKDEALLEVKRRQAEEEYDRVMGLSHGCKQTWDLRVRGERGATLKINGLFY